MRVTVRSKMVVGVGFLMTLVVAIGLFSALEIGIIEQRFLDVAEVDEPNSAAAYEMEINLIGTGFGLLGYLHDHDPRHLDRIRDDAKDFSHYLREHRSLLDRSRTRLSLEEYNSRYALSDEMERRYDRFSTLASDLIEADDEQVAKSASLRDVLEQIDVLLDDHIQVGISPNDDEAYAKLSAALDMEINANGIARGLGNYLRLHSMDSESRVRKDERDFVKHLDQYRSLPLSSQEKEWAERVEDYFYQVVMLTKRIIEIEKLKEAGLRKFVRSRREIDGLLDNQMQATTYKHLAEAKSAVHATVERSRSLIVGLLVLGVVVGGVTATMVVKSIVRPVTNLVATTRAVTAGDLSRRVEVQSADELGDLGSYFNQMLEARQAAVLALQESKEYADDILRSINDMLVVVAPDGSIATVNDAVCRQLRYQKEELVGQSLDVLCPEEDEEDEAVLHEVLSQEMIPLDRGVLHDLLRNGAAGHIEKCLRTKNGKEIPVVMSGSIVRGSEGQITGVVCVAQDISKRKLSDKLLLQAKEDAEVRARELESQRYALDEHSLVAITDPKGRITYANDKFCEISQYSREELVGQDHRILNSGHHPKSYMTNLWKTIGQGKVWKGDIKNKAKDGSEYWVKTTIVPFTDSAGTITQYVAIRTDITDRKSGEQELIEAKEQAIMAAQAKSDFLANMSHEIRTPMTAILGYTELLMDPKRSDEDKKYTIDTIHRNGEHLLAIINDILDLSKIEAGKMSVDQIDCSPHQILIDLASLMKVRSDSKGLDLKVDCVGAIPRMIQTDPGRLRQILVNLVGNSVKFTEQGGVHVTAKMEAQSDPQFPMLRVEVLDTGIGMSQEQIDKLFRPFTQADTSTTRQFGGTGLGLTISKRFVELLGGDISVTSTRGKGTSFVVTVATGPLEGVEMIDRSIAEVCAEIKKNSKAPKEVTAINQPLKNVRILLAEDGADNQRLISYILSKWGAEVTLADNGRIAMENAVSALKENVPFDVILMDMQMPEMDGYTATRLLRESQYRAPIIALTAHTMSDDRDKCLDAGCDDYATKPINKSKLLDTIQLFLRSNSSHAA